MIRKQRTLVSSSSRSSGRSVSSRNHSRSNTKTKSIRFPPESKKTTFVLYYQNYQDEQDFVVGDQNKEYLPSSAGASSSSSTMHRNGKTSTLSSNLNVLNPMTIPTNIPSIDLPRAVFEKLQLMESSSSFFSSYNKREEENNFPDIEILSGRIAIVLSLYLYSTEILTGEGVLDQVSHLFS